MSDTNKTAAAAVAKAADKNGKDEEDTFDGSDMEKELAIIDGIPATPFHQTIVKLPRLRSYNAHLKIHPYEENADIQNLLARDCTLAFTARPKEEDQAYSSGSTFFVPCQMKPRCLLEALALDIFKAHASSLIESHSDKGDDICFDPERSGAEWWTLVMDAAPPNSNDDSDSSLGSKDPDDEEEEDDVGMHFDADYGLEDMLPSLIHPHISTITYLSDVGVPTLILDKTSPPPEDAEHKKTLGGSISKGFLSYPKFGKHVAFDGRLLHGASAAFFPSIHNSFTSSSASKDETLKRITFLVNIWFNHIPVDADLLPEEFLSQMSPCPWYQYEKLNGTTINGEASKIKRLKGDPLPIPYTFPKVTDSDKLSSYTISSTTVEKNDDDDDEDDDSQRIETEVHTVICGREVAMSLKSEQIQIDQLVASMQSTETGGSAEIRFEKDSLTLLVGDEVEYSSEEEDEDDE